jgi:hypothetical protein
MRGGGEVLDDPGDLELVLTGEDERPANGVSVIEVLLRNGLGDDNANGS